MPRFAALAALLTFPTCLPAADTPLPKVPPGFRAELVLQAPQVEAPTALCVAPNGDVYFAEDPMDMAGPPTKNLDRIWLLKGGDPAKKVLFADKLWAVMGLEIVRDKLYVVHAPYVSVFTLDAEGKAKARTDLFTDLGPPVAGVPSFNDHIPSGIRMGMDGWLYVSVGDKGIPKMARKEKDHGSVHVAEGRWRHSQEGHHISLEGGGVIRFRPDGGGLEVFASGTRNHLDVPLDEHDRIFVRDNTDDGLGWWTRLMYLPRGAFMGYPWAYRRRPKEVLPMIRDFGGGSPCGGWVYLDDGLPAAYRGRIFHCEWGQGKVWAVKVAPDGAGFKFVDQVEFMGAGGVKDFRPFTLRPTADGRGFYVTDWGFSGWSQPVKAGRIWKVTYTGAEAKPAPRGKDTDSVEQLVQALDHPAHSERLRALRALVARGVSVVGEVQKHLSSAHSTTQGKIGALWVLGALEPRKALDWIKDQKFNRLDKDLQIEILRLFADERVRPLAKRYRVTGNSYLNNLYDHILERVEPRDAAVMMFAILADYHLEGRRDSIHCDPPFLFRGGDDLLTLLPIVNDPFVQLAYVRVLQINSKVGLLIRFAKDDAPQPPEHDGGPFTKEFWADRLDRAVIALLFRPDYSFIALNDRFSLPAVRVLKDCLGFKHRPDLPRRLAVEALARNYKDRRPYAGTWWGTQPAAQRPPARDVEWEGTPLVRGALIQALGDKDAGARKAALRGLVAANDPATLEPLTRQFAREKNAEARADIVRAVAGLETPKAADFLAGILADAKAPEPLRLEAVAGLEKNKAPAAAQALARAANAKEPVAIQVRALEALGIVKAPAAKDVCAAGLKSAEPAVRRAAADTLGKLGDTYASALLLPLLQDRGTAVRVAAIQALGALKARDAVPALIQAAGNDATQFDAVTALTRVPDKRALTAYLTGLGSKNAALRAASREALTAVREEVLPALKELVQRNELRPEVLPELRAVYQSFAPVLQWRLIGPFPADGKARPPEKELKFEAAYPGAGDKQVRWRAKQGDPRAHGKVNLAALFSPSSNVVAYGYAEIESDTERDSQLLVGSDDTVVIWLNGRKVHSFGGDRGWRHDQEKVSVRLKKGRNALLVKCGNHGGPWEYSVGVSGDAARYAFLQGGGKKFDLEAFRAYARKAPGDAARGERLFRDLRGLACAKCHAVGGAGGQVGPDLAGIALKYRREDLMTSVLEPSKTIAQGYETIVVETKKGQILTGVFKGETADAIRLADNEGKQHRIAKKEVEDRVFSPVSLMPNGLSDGMTLQDFADLIAYLEARREASKPEAPPRGERKAR